MLCPSRSTWVRFATPTKDIGTDPDRFPLLFNQTIHYGTGPGAVWRIGEQSVPSSHRKWLYAVLSAVVAQPQTAILRIADQVGLFKALNE